MVDLSSYLVTGTNNAAKQVSVNYQNGLINAIEDGINNSSGSGPIVNLSDYLASPRTPFVTDDLPAFDAALAAMKAMEVGDAGIPKLVIPSGKYYCSDTINVHCCCLIEGGGAGGDAGTLIRFAPNKNGIVFNYDTTHGDTAPGSGQGNSGGSTLQNLAIWGGNVTVNGSGTPTSYAAGVSPSGHGIRIRAPFIAVKDVFVAFFGQDGFNINATAGSGGSTDGNANSIYLERCQSIYNGRYGYLFNGNDVNACTINTCSAISNAGCGFAEYSFLGNTYIQPHARDNGYTDATGNLNPVGVCTYGGHEYYARADKLTEASTTTPGTDSTVWVQFDGLLHSRTWVTGQTWVLPGGYATNPSNSNARNVFIGTYGEAGQSPIQAQQPSLFIGGLVEEMGFISTSAAMYPTWMRGGSFGAFRAAGIEAATGTEVATLGLYSQSMLRWTDGTDTFRLEKTSGGTAAFSLDGTGVLFYALNNGVELPSGRGFRINGNQVVGARGAAVADATDAASAITQLNALLARCRAHGLIA